MTWKKKEKPPAHVGVLHQWIAQHSKAIDIAAPRLQRRISFMVMAGALDRIRDENGGRLFVLKGGVTMELRANLQARATQDLDVSHRIAFDEVIEELDDSLREPYGDFTFERLDEPYLNEEFGFINTDIRVNYRGRSFQNVKLELMAAEGASGDDVDLVPAFEIDEYGLEGPEEVACLPLRYQIAQKLHACTDVADDGKPNERSRDLIDIILIRDLLEPEVPYTVRNACVEIFEIRNRHEWPPTVRIWDGWAEQYRAEVADLDFPVETVEEAARRVDEIIGEINAAREDTT